MRKTSPKSNATSAIERGITLTSILRIQKESKKISVSLGDFHIGNWD